MILSCKNISKSFGINTILADVSFHISYGQRVALVGRNGTGKSTLFKIIAGEISKDSGNIITPKNTTIGYLSQKLDLNEENSLWVEMVNIFNELIELEQQIRFLEKEISKKSNSQDLPLLMEEYGHLQEKFEELNGYSYPSQIRGVLTGLGFSEADYSKSIANFSGGQKTRIALAKLLLIQPQILLLDEPTNFLDLDGTEWLETYLSSYPHTLFIISHDRYFLDALVDQVLELENHKITIYQGNYSQYVRYKKEDQKIAFHQYREQQKEIKRQEEIIAKYRSFNREKSIKKAESRQKALDKIVLLERPEQQKNLNLSIQPEINSGRDVLKVEDLSKSFGDHEIFNNISFQIYKGEHIGIIGPNGVGKSTLFNIMLNRLSSDSGNVTIGRNVYPAYFDQLQALLDSDNTILEELWKEKPSATETEIRNLLGAFLFSGDDVYKEISTLSGGERSRVSLAKLMLSKANLLLMDEPTNHLDIDTKEVLEDALIQYKGTLLVISHDRYFLNKVVHKIFKMNRKGMEVFLGNYDYYLEKKKQEQLLREGQQIAPIINKTQLKQERRKEREYRQAFKNQQQRIVSLEHKIEELEKKIYKLEHIMCQPNFYDDGDRVQDITKDYNNSKEELKETMLLWEENMILLEEMGD